MKVLWLTNIPSPYRVQFFNELGKYCDLTVLFEKSTSTERDTTWKNYECINFEGIVLTGKDVSVDQAISLEVIKYLNDGMYDHIVVSNAATPTGVIAIEYMKIFNIEYYIEGDGGFPKSGKGLKEYLKKHINSGAKAYFSTAKSHDEYYLKYGAKKERIYRYPFTSITKRDILEKTINREEKSKLKESLGIKEKKVILSVGQFIHRKGYDILLKACKDFNDDVGIYLLGGEPTDEYLELKRKMNLNNVHFVEFKEKAQLNEYYNASDLFVLPTREDIWGLVINEAMAKGLPIITTDKCVAGLELVGNNGNGFIIPSENEDVLFEKMNIIINNDELLNRMSKRSLEVIQEYTIENMAKKHLDIFAIKM